MNEIEQLLKSAQSIVVQAAAKLKPHFGNVSYRQKANDDYFDVVTKLDYSTEEFIDQQLAKVNPSIGFYGEEHGQTRTGERQWVLDPIDGTSLFIRGIPMCSTMLALVEGPEVLLAIIVNIANGDTYSAVRSGGAHKNGQPIHVSKRKLREAFIGFEVDRSKRGNEEVADRFRSVSMPYKSMNSGWEFCMTAEGKLDGRIQKDPWGGIYDFAAGSLLVKEAGGVVANIGVETYDYRNLNFIATNEVIYNELVHGKNAIFPLEYA